MDRYLGGNYGGAEGSAINTVLFEIAGHQRGRAHNGLPAGFNPEPAAAALTVAIGRYGLPASGRRRAD